MPGQPEHSPLPTWTSLKASPSPILPSDEDVQSSSQDMRDELSMTPPPQSTKKRNRRSSNSYPASRGTSKKSRLSGPRSREEEDSSEDHAESSRPPASKSGPSAPHISGLRRPIATPVPTMSEPSFGSTNLQNLDELPPDPPRRQWGRKSTGGKQVTGKVTPAKVTPLSALPKPRSISGLHKAGSSTQRVRRETFPASLPSSSSVSVPVSTAGTRNQIAANTKAKETQSLSPPVSRQPLVRGRNEPIEISDDGDSAPESVSKPQLLPSRPQLPTKLAPHEKLRSQSHKSKDNTIARFAQEPIEISSDDDEPAPAPTQSNESNPIVISSDDDEDAISASVLPVVKASGKTSESEVTREHVSFPHKYPPTDSVIAVASGSSSSKPADDPDIAGNLNVDAILPALDDMSIMPASDESRMSVEGPDASSMDETPLIQGNISITTGLRTFPDPGLTRHTPVFDGQDISMAPPIETPPEQPYSSTSHSTPSMNECTDEQPSSTTVSEPQQSASLSDDNSISSSSKSQVVGNSQTRYRPRTSTSSVDIKGSLYSGPSGFFKSIHKNPINRSANRRASTSVIESSHHRVDRVAVSLTRKEESSGDGEGTRGMEQSSVDDGNAQQIPKSEESISSTAQEDRSLQKSDLKPISSQSQKPLSLPRHSRHKQRALKSAASSNRPPSLGDIIKAAAASNATTFTPIDLTRSDDDSDSVLPADASEEGVALPSARNLAKLLPGTLGHKETSEGLGQDENKHVIQRPVGRTITESIKRKRIRQMGKASPSPQGRPAENTPETPLRDREHGNSYVAIPAPLPIESESHEHESSTDDRNSPSSGSSNEVREELLASPDTPDLEMSDSDNSVIIDRRRRSKRLRSTGSSANSSLHDLPETFGDRPQGHVPHVLDSPSSEGLVAAMRNIDLGGVAFEFLTWEQDGIDMARECTDVYMLAKDMPHGIQDHMNALSPSARYADDMQRKVFEAVISECTAKDEPNAPPIQIINHVDDELTPPYEFHYTNHMWHSANVPKPDLDNLQGCNCQGVCDPTLGTCSCARRQEEEYDEECEIQSGFIYDGKKRLRAHKYPIIECNAFCRCGDGCRNRVVQHGRKVEVNIQKTEKKGWGVFAGSKRIPRDTFIGIYSGELLTDGEGEERGFKYNIFGRTYLFDIDFWFLREHVKDWEVKYCVDAYHAGNFTRYLNHSCNPNCNINACYINEANMEKPLLAIFTLRDIEAGEELCFSYCDPVQDEPGSSKEQSDAVYAPCQCGAINCTGRIWC